MILVTFPKHCLPPAFLCFPHYVLTFQTSHTHAFSRVLTLTLVLTCTHSFSRVLTLTCSHVHSFSRVLTLMLIFSHSFSHILLLHTCSLVHSFSHILSHSHTGSHTHLSPHSHPSVALDSSCPCLPLLRDRLAPPSELPTSPFHGSFFLACTSLLKPS